MTATDAAIASSPAATSSAPARLPSLDGLRALSIALVMVSHALRVFDGSWRARLWGNYGALGVSVFFVISGFVITTLLLREEASAGRIDFRGFYVRRAYRILPAYFAYLAAVCLLATLDDIQIAPRDFFSALFFFRDYAQRADGYWVGHTWSLAVEEHFYIVYPIFLAVVPARLRARWLAVVVALGPVLRAATLLAWPSLHWNVLFMFHTRMDFLAAGCLTAIVVRDGRARAVANALNRPIRRVLLLAGLFVVSPILDVTVPHYLYMVGFTVELTLIALLIIDTVLTPSSRLGRALNHPLAVHVGAISYSLYLWQQMFFGEPHARFSFVTSAPFNLVGTILLAEASYAWVEKPFLALRRRMPHAHGVAGSASR